MKDTNLNQKIIANDLHLKNIFIGDLYLELGIIDIDVMQRLLKYELINVNEVTFFPVQNKGLGHSFHNDNFLKNYLPFFFFQKLATNNPSYQLCITYGLLEYRKVEKREAFMPIILIPIKIYYENNDLLIQMTSPPMENPMIYSVINSSTKLSFMQGLNLHDIQVLDYILFTINKINGFSVRIDNYLTYAEQKERDIILNYKNFITERTEYKLASDKIYRVDPDLFMSRVLNKEQRIFLERVNNKENLALTGFSGTGKTTVLKDFIVNNMRQGLKTLYISNSNESINDVYNFLSDYKLERYCVNFLNSFNKISSINYDDVYLENLENTNDLLLQLNEYYDLLDKYEEDINKGIYDFRFIEIINNYFLIENPEYLDEIDSLKEYIDDVHRIYKHEYEEIFSVLKKLEYNSQKIKSFQNSVWNQIPILNNIKHVNQVINVVFQLNKGLKNLREYEILLGNHGVKSILSFSEMKKCIEPMDKITYSIIPDEWKTSLDVYYEAKNKYQEIRADIYKFQEAEYYLSTKYKNLSNINIDDEIELLYGEFYKQSSIDVIEKILDNKKEILKNIEQSQINLQNFYSFSKEISQLIHWNFLEKDEYVNEIRSLGILFKDNYINGKMLTIILNNKVEQETSQLQNLHKNIKLLITDIEKLENEYKKLSTLDFSKGNVKYENEDYRTYDTKVKKLRRLSKEYVDICGGSYKNHEKNLLSIAALKNYYNSIKHKKYRKILVDFIQGLDEDGYIEILSLFTMTSSSYKNISSEIEYFSQYQIDFNTSTIFNNIKRFDSYLQYLISLYNSNSRLDNVVLNNELTYVKPSEYYEIRKKIDDYNRIVAELKNNEKYQNLYGYLYSGEETNVLNIAKIIQMYDAYIQVFISPEKVYQSFVNFEDLRTVIDNIVTLVSEIGENLRLYSLIFKDSVSRYYFSNIENNVEYLSKLLDAKNELILYLNITQGIGVLNEYKLTKLIKYIEENDDITGIANKFSCLYFKGLVEDFLENKEYLKDTKEYLELLNKTIALENVICKLKGNEIINQIISDNPLEFKKKDIKHFDYPRYLKRYKHLLVYLCDKDFAINYIKDINFDVIVIDDAQMIISGDYNTIFKGKQIVICGDYQSNKIVNQNLISLATNYNAAVLKKRYDLGPKKLTNNIVATRCPYQKTLSGNLGLKVIEKGLDNYIYNLYIDDYNVKINYFIKDINYQREVYEQIAKSFYKKNVSPDEIINFLNNNLFITDINTRNYIKSDYNIIYLKDYCFEDSQIISSNMFEVLMLAKKELIIYDTEHNLLQDIKSEFFNQLKPFVLEKTIFTGHSLDHTIEKIAVVLEQRGYEINYPGNGVNFVIRKLDSDELITVVILYSNGYIYEMLNLYREIYEEYRSNGHKVIFKVIPDLLLGVEKFIDSLLEDING